MTTDSAKDAILEKLLEDSGHGTRPEDVERIFNAGAKAEADKWRPILTEVLKEAADWLFECRGREPHEVGDWAERAQALIDGGGK